MIQILVVIGFHDNKFAWYLAHQTLNLKLWDGIIKKFLTLENKELVLY